jgi:hypothetical protein
MQKVLFILAVSFVTNLILTSCGLDCVDKKTGLYKSSQTLNEAQTQNLFQFEFAPNKSIIHLDSGLALKIKNAWTENNWKYECINNAAEIVKDTSLQFVVDADYDGDAINSNYWLGNNHLGTVLDYSYFGQDTVTLSLSKDKRIVDTITFVRQQVSR